jgi:two-component system response regulator
MGKTGTQDVLLVEDDPADIYLIQRAIADCSPDIRMWLVSRGSDALPFLRHEPPFGNVPSPALILLDLNLPERDGHAILGELRGVAPYHTTPVVVLSGNERAREEARCRRLGATAYVQKSTDFATYFGSIQALIRDWLGANSSPPEGSTTGSGKRLQAGALPQLLAELSILRQVLESRVAHPEDAVAIDSLGAAERAAKAGETAQVMACLKQAGRWPWAVAVEIGATLAAETLQQSLGR